MPGINSEPKFMGFDEFEVRNAARQLTEVVSFAPKLLRAAKAWIKKDQENQKEAVKLTDNLK